MFLLVLLVLDLFLIVDSLGNDDDDTGRQIRKQMRRAWRQARREERRRRKLGLFGAQQPQDGGQSFPSDAPTQPLGVPQPTDFIPQPQNTGFPPVNQQPPDEIIENPDVPQQPPPRQPQAPKVPQTPSLNFKIPGIGGISLPVISPFAFQNAIQSASQFMTGIQTTERNLGSKRLFASPNSVEGEHQDFLGNNPNSQRVGWMGQMIMTVITNLAKAFGITIEQSQQVFQALQPAQNLIQQSGFTNSVTGSCPQPVRCFDSIYRTADGSCNNRRNGDWGKSFSPFNRMAQPEYEDGFDAPRVTGRSSRQFLPSSRVVSFTVAPDSNQNSDSLTLMVMQWGQFLDHDMTGAATTRAQNGQSIRCCGVEFQRNPNLLHPACFPIDIPPNDPFYSREGKTCMSFVRSAAAVRPGCEFGPREQLNQLSAYIDGGMIYGKTQEETNNLRAFMEGKLKTSIVDGGHFLPQNQNAGGCQIPRDKQQQGSLCFSAGDSRVNVQANLVVIHTLFLRYHNWVASQLARVNPHWDDETLFQEARRIVIAQIQMVTYNEFLPVVLGDNVMSTKGLKVQDNGYANSYDENTNAQILSSFATAAYRMHTLIPKTLQFMDGRGKSVGQVDLSETFNNPSIVYESGAYTSLLNGLISQSAADFDQFFSNQVSNHMFRPFGRSSGIDLVAVNIQRGRDHGLPSYNKMRNVCGLPPISSWQELSSVMRPGAAEALRSVYASVGDIDLFIGGVSEQSLPNSLVGPTFSCILSEQFRRLKDGDRFWFENGPNTSPYPFTQEQLAELRKTSLAKIICQAGKEIDSVQPFVMMKPNNEWNQKSPCSSLPDIDFSVFRGQ